MEDEAFDKGIKSLSAALTAIKLLRNKGDPRSALEIASQIFVVVHDLVKLLQQDAADLQPIKSNGHDNVIKIKSPTEIP